MSNLKLQLKYSCQVKLLIYKQDVTLWLKYFCFYYNMSLANTMETSYLQLISMLDFLEYNQICTVGVV
jgi:hypothetical protein